jgi:hypothetical protein
MQFRVSAEVVHRKIHVVKRATEEVAFLMCKLTNWQRVFLPSEKAKGCFLSEINSRKIESGGLRV